MLRTFQMFQDRILTAEGVVFDDGFTVARTRDKHPVLTMFGSLEDAVREMARSGETQLLFDQAGG